MSYWYIINSQCKSQGPFSENDLLEKLESNELPHGQLIWTQGMNTWEPIESHFQKLTGNSISRNFSRKSDPTISFKNKSKLVIYSSITFFSLCVFMLIRAFWDDIEHSALFWTSCVMSFFATTTFGVLSAQESWKVAQSNYKKFGGTSGGKLKVYSVCLLLFFSCFITYYTFQYSFFMRVENEREFFNKYTIAVNHEERKIDITGPIGPGMAKKLKKYIKSHELINTIEISSAGGLMDEAMKIAKIIESRGNLDLVARKNCDSACIVVFMAGNKKYADQDMSFGFHSTEAITDMSSLYDDGVGYDVDAYLLERGIPREILDHSFSGNSSEIYKVPASYLQELGIIDLLLEPQTETH